MTIDKNKLAEHKKIFDEWFESSKDEDGNWIKNELFEIDPQTGELRRIEGSGPFWNEGGEYWGHDWLWRDADGRIFAYTDREYFIYHFPRMLEGYINNKKKDLGYQSETSLVLGIGFRPVVLVLGRKMSP